MHTKLIEFKNKYGDTLRGILTYSEKENAKTVVIMGGFERTATTETKFKNLADLLIKNNIPSFRFDHTGVGLSDGDFSKISIKNLSDDLLKAINSIKKEILYEKISFLSHSLPPCIISDKNLRDMFEKIVMISPALNQKDLLRYWFVVSLMKKKDSSIKTTWDNYKNYLNEDEFLKHCQDSQKLTKAHFVGSEYFLESKDIDYSTLIPDSENILHVHGEKDDTVPLTSLNTDFKNKIIVEGGDHDIERPDMFIKWSKKVVDFINKK